MTSNITGPSVQTQGTCGLRNQSSSWDPRPKKLQIRAILYGREQNYGPKKFTL